MESLTFGDASFLYAETDKAPTHAATLQLFEVPAANRATFVDDLKRLMKERRHLVPYLTHRLVFVPGNLDHPVWVDDADFDADHHIQSVDLGGEGTMRELEDTVARLHEGRWSLDRPLWRIVVIEGLANGRAAYYSAVHHCCVDGMGGQLPINALTDTSAEPTHVIPEQRTAEAEPSSLELVAGALGRLTRAGFQQWTAVPKLLKTGGALLSRALDSKKTFGAYTMGAPKTSLNVEIDERRTLAVGRLPLGDVKAIGKQFDCTVNDVFMAVTAGGLRRYLERHDELPEEPLIAGCPVSLRTSDDKGQNNQVTSMLVSLETHITDPVERMIGIRESAKIGKAVTAELFGSGGLELRMPGLPGLISGAMGLAERTHLTERVSMPLNVAISNIPGPRHQLYSNGAKMVGLFPVSLPMQGVGAILTVMGYLDFLDFSITAATTAMPEPQELRDDMLAAFLELSELVLDRPARAADAADSLAA
jgi:WS/DGAT/MGAT family acyltransferase